MTVEFLKRGLEVQLRQLAPRLTWTVAPALPAGEEPWRSLPHFSYDVHDELDTSAAAVARIRAAQKASRVLLEVVGHVPLSDVTS